MRPLLPILLLALSIGVGARAAIFPVTSADDSGPGSLRQAILDANARPGSDAIRFRTFFVIHLRSALPVIRETLALSGGIRGWVVLDGTDAGEASGLVLDNADGSEIGAIDVVNFRRNGIEVDGSLGVRVEACKLTKNGQTGLRIQHSPYAWINDLRTEENDIGVEVIEGDAFFQGMRSANNRSYGSRFRDAMVQLRPAPCMIPEGCGPIPSNETVNNGAGGWWLEGGTLESLGGYVAGNHGDGVTIARGILHWMSGSITHNTGNGVTVLGGSAFINGLISDNDGLSVDLNGDGPSTNDPLDGDSGADGMLNTPMIAAARSFPIRTEWTNEERVIQTEGTFRSAPSSNMTLDFYGSENCHNPSSGESSIWLGSAYVTTDVNGTADFRRSFITYSNYFFHPVVNYVSVTATGPAGISEYSPCVAVERHGETGGDLALSSITIDHRTAIPGDVVQAYVTVTNNGPGAMLSGIPSLDNGSGLKLVAARLDGSGFLGPGDSARWELYLSVEDDAPPGRRDVIARTKRWSIDDDIDPSNDFASTTVRILNVQPKRLDIGLTLHHRSNGEAYVTVVNRGSRAAVDETVQISSSDSESFDVFYQATPLGIRPDCSSGYRRTATCRIALLLPGESVTLGAKSYELKSETFRFESTNVIEDAHPEDNMLIIEPALRKPVVGR